MIPFAGLAIISHLIIILIRKVYEKLNFRFSFNFLKKEVVSYLIIFFIFGAIMTITFFIIKNSIINSPNIQIVEKSFSNEEVIAESSLDNTLPEKISNNESDGSSLSDGILIKNNCSAVTSPKISNEPIVSIVDFLALNCIDDSFKNRALIAAHFGIDNYVSSAEQNIKLISILKTGQFLK